MSKWSILKSALVSGKREHTNSQSIHRFNGFNNLINKNRLRIWSGFIMKYELDDVNDITINILIDRCNKFMINIDTNECTLHVNVSKSSVLTIHEIVEELNKCLLFRFHHLINDTAVFYISHKSLICSMSSCEYWQYNISFLNNNTANSLSINDNNDDINIHSSYTSNSNTSSNSSNTSSNRSLLIFTREAPRDHGLNMKGLLSNKINAGVDNTGNICVWPAEPILLHTLCNIPQFIELIKDKRILEIGGGLTSLAGLGIAASRDLKDPEVIVTDGHPACVLNQKVCIEMCRQQGVNLGRITACELHWSPVYNTEQVASLTDNGNKRFEVIIASDCLFFKDFHIDLISTLLVLLDHNTGVCCFLQPRRAGTMELFIHRCRPYFDVEVMEYFSPQVKMLRNEYLQSSSNSTLQLGYNEDIHYPILLLLRVRQTDRQTTQLNTNL